jgi:hypothetical protein
MEMSYWSDSSLMVRIWLEDWLEYRYWFDPSLSSFINLLALIRSTIWLIMRTCAEPSVEKY